MKREKVIEPESADPPEKPKAYVRKCKQCGQVMGHPDPEHGKLGEPLAAEGKLWMFCSAKCRTIWDHERAYAKATEKKHRSFE